MTPPRHAGEHLLVTCLVAGLALAGATIIAIILVRLLAPLTGAL